MSGVGFGETEMSDVMRVGQSATSEEGNGGPGGVCVAHCVESRKEEHKCSLEH